MQTHGGQAAEDAIVNSTERRFHVRVDADWYRNGYSGLFVRLTQFVKSVTTDRSLSGSAPEELLLIEGAAAAELEVVLGGSYVAPQADMVHPIATVFSPYNGLSPLYGENPIGAEIRYAIGIETALGIIWYDQFIGNVRTINVNRADGTVTITALDRVEQLRAPVHVPAWAVYGPYQTQGWREAQLIDSQSIIDNCLRYGHTSSTSNHRHTYTEEQYVVPDHPLGDSDGCILWVTGNGTYVPTIGWLDNMGAQGFPRSEAGGNPMYDHVGAIPRNATIPSGYALSWDTSRLAAFTNAWDVSSGTMGYATSGGLNLSSITPTGTHATQALLSPEFEVTGGMHYRFNARLWSGTSNTQRNFSIGVRWYYEGTTTTHISHAYTPVRTGALRDLEEITYQAPANAVRARIEITQRNTPQNTWWFRSASMEELLYVPPRTKNLTAVANDPTGAPVTWANTPPGTRSASQLQYWASASDELINDRGTHWFGFTLMTQGRNSTFYQGSQGTDVLTVTASNNIEFLIRVVNGNAQTWFYNKNTQWQYFGVQIPVPDYPWVPIMATWDITEFSGLRYRLKVGGYDTGWVATGVTSINIPRDTATFAGIAKLSRRVGVQDVWWSMRNMSAVILDNPLPGRGDGYAIREAEYGAVLDEGKNKLSSTQLTQGTDAWDIITDVAAAELGSVFWDEHGIFRFWNRDTILEKQNEMVRTISLDDTSALEITNQLDGVRTVINATVKDRQAVSGVVIEASDENQFYLPPGYQARGFKIPLENAVFVSPWKVPGYRTQSSSVPNPLPLWNDNGTHNGFVCEWLNDGQWLEDHDLEGAEGVQVFASMDHEGNAIVWIRKPYAAAFRLTKLRIRGTKIEDYGDKMVSIKSDEAIEKYGRRNFEVSGDWYQVQPDDHYPLFESVLERTSEPIPTTDAITIAGDPRLQLGDTIRLYDPNGFGEEMKLQIYGIKREWSLEGGLVDTLTVEMIRPSGIGIWDSQHYGLWDQTFYWSY